MGTHTINGLSLPEWQAMVYFLHCLRNEPDEARASWLTQPTEAHGMALDVIQRCDTRPFKGY